MGIVDLVRMGIAPELSQLSQLSQSQDPTKATGAAVPGVGSGELATAIPATFATDTPNSSKNSNRSSSRAHEIVAQGKPAPGEPPTLTQELIARLLRMAQRHRYNIEETAELLWLAVEDPAWGVGAVESDEELHQRHGWPL